MTQLTYFTAKQLIFNLLFIIPFMAWAQPGATVDIQKPAKYERRTLPSEKPTDKPLNPIKRATQNLGSHYNYYFNGNQKLNEVLYNAGSAKKEDYAKLLDFYRIMPDATANQASELDSVIGKCNDAILLHDLRSDWVDDFYFLMGKAFFYRKEFDSALIAFQYVNYAFQPRSKEEIGYPKSIGSNTNGQGNSFTVSTKEKNNLVQKIAGHPPARNEAILWIIRSLIEKDQSQDSWSLIETLKRDKNFPPRLTSDLKELQAYLFYKENQYDSAALYLEASLANFSSEEKARQEYLLAQLYERSKNTIKADYWYEKAIGHTTDLIMEAFARINRIRLVQNHSSNEKIDEQIKELMKMVNKEKYADYKHFIYYAVAQMEKARDSIGSALFYLQKTAQNSTNDPSFRNKAFLELGNLAWENRNYRMAYVGYDSVMVNDTSVGINAFELNDRKKVLSKIITHLNVIHIEDSLMQIAVMPEAERTAYLKTLLRELRKAKGLKEELSNTSNFKGNISSVTDPTKEEKPADLFADNKSKGDWYFYNVSLKSKGVREFEATWGKRPNADNWRRAKAITNVNEVQAKIGESAFTDSTGMTVNSKAQPSVLSLEALEENLPLSQEQKKASLDTIEVSMYQLGKIFREELNDCASVIQNNEKLLNRFPSSPHTEEVVFGLYYCYQQAGNTAKAKVYKNYLAEKHAQGQYVKMIENPKAAALENNQLTIKATDAYEKIYQSFIEGDFEKAMSEKRVADSSYGENYWTPQLLYIEAIHQIRQRNDSLATNILNKLQMLFPTSAMAPKAKTLATVLGTRAELEKYLTDLNIERVKEDSIFIAAERAKTSQPVIRKENTLPQKLATPAPVLTAPKPARKTEQLLAVQPKKAKDTVQTIKSLTVKADTSSFKKPALPKAQMDGYTFNPSEEHLVLLVLQKVDIVYVNEAKNALNRYNKANLPDKTLELQNSTYNTDIRLLSIGGFPSLSEAVDYTKQVSTDAPRNIFPWLPANKYYFLIASPSNLEILTNKQEIERYKQLFAEKFPLNK